MTCTEKDDEIIRLRRVIMDRNMKIAELGREVISMGEKLEVANAENRRLSGWVYELDPEQRRRGGW